MVQLLQGGTVSQSYSYNAYGYINADEYGIRAPFFGYNGEEQNPFTGLQYLRARYYAPQNGGFITQDSFSGILTNALSQNRYTYAENDPVNGIDPSGHARAPKGATKGGGNKKDTTGSLGTSGQTSRTGSASSSAKPPYTTPPARPSSTSSSSRRPLTMDHLPTGSTRDAFLHHAATTPGFKDNLSSQWEQYRETLQSSSSPAADLMMRTVSDPYLAFGSTTGLAPSVIEDFAESAKALIRSTCDAQRNHYTAQLASQWAIDQATLNIFGDALDGISDWWSRNGSTFMRGVTTVVIGASTVVVAVAAAPAATLFGGAVVVVAGGAAILGVTDIVLGAVDLTAAITDDADLRGFVSSPEYMAVEGGAMLFSMAGSAALQPYAALSQMLARAAQANAQNGSTWDMPSNPKDIDGRTYTQHALERMAPDTLQTRAELERRASEAALQKGLLQGTAAYDAYVSNYVHPRGVPPMAVEGTIQTVEPIPGNFPDTFVYRSADLEVVVNGRGDVITVIPIDK